MFDDVLIVTEPDGAAVPESLTLLKTALRVEHTADDTYLTDLMQSAAAQITSRTGRQVLTCTRRLGLCEWWTGSIDLPYPKLQTVNSIEYLDPDGATQTLDSGFYSVFTSGLYGRVVMRDTGPELDPDAEKPISIYYDCGYGIVETAVPSGLRVAIRELVRCWYEEKFPRDRFPEHVDALLDTWKLSRFWK